jgi:hypothetical protein
MIDAQYLVQLSAAGPASPGPVSAPASAGGVVLVSGSPVPASEGGVVVASDSPPESVPPPVAGAGLLELHASERLAAQAAMMC